MCYPNRAQAYLTRPKSSHRPIEFDILLNSWATENEINDSLMVRIDLANQHYLIQFSNVLIYLFIISKFCLPYKLKYDINI